MIVLGIETSCDETGLALYDTSQGLLHHVLFSQIDLHAEYGGVVPELASRDHVRRLPVLFEELLKGAAIKKEELDAIAVTKGPGLVGALMVGISFAKSLSLALNIPCIDVHHMEGHLLAPMLEDNPPEFPFVALLVSGGHSMLVHVKALGEYEVLGETIDDAAGEAFDKTAKMMGLPYPGGPKLAELAEQSIAGKFKFTRPLIDRPGCDFSFSGLKTQVLNAFMKSDKTEQTKADIARAFEETIVDTMRIKITRALEQTGLNTLVLAGGVSANKRLRETLGVIADKNSWQLYYPRTEFCTDNGAMIAFAGAMRLKDATLNNLKIEAVARWPLERLS